jgi:hypothetical protein
MNVSNILWKKKREGGGGSVATFSCKTRKQHKLHLNLHKQWEQYGAKKYSIKDAFSIVHTAMDGG